MANLNRHADPLPDIRDAAYKVSEGGRALMTLCLKRGARPERMKVLQAAIDFADWQLKETQPRNVTPLHTGYLRKIDGGKSDPLEVA